MDSVQKVRHFSNTPLSQTFIQILFSDLFGERRYESKEESSPHLRFQFLSECEKRSQNTQFCLIKVHLVALWVSELYLISVVKFNDIVHRVRSHRHDDIKALEIATRRGSDWIGLDYVWSHLALATEVI